MSVYEVLLLNMAPEILLLLSMQFLLLLILSGNTGNFSKHIKLRFCDMGKNAVNGLKNIFFAVYYYKCV